MSRRIIGAAMAALMLVLSLVACAAPVASPSAPPPTQPKPVEQVAAAPKLSDADKAWQGVVSAARKEGKATLYSYSMIGDVGLAVSQPFSKKYGISIDIITGRGAQMAERIKTEQTTKSMTADLMDANPTQLMYLKDLGSTVSSKDLPEIQDRNLWLVDPLVADKDGHILEHTLLTHTVFVNTKLVPASEEPKTIAELAGPKWKGKLIAMDPTFSSGTYILLGTLLRLKYIDEATVRAIGRNDLKLAVNAQTSAAEVARGERALELGNAIISYAPMMNEGAPVKAIAMQEGTIASGNAIAMIKGGPHPNAARVFLNWLMSQEGQTVYIKAQALSSPRKDVADFRPLAAQVKPSRLIALTEDDEKANAQLFRDQVLVKLWKE